MNWLDDIRFKKFTAKLEQNKEMMALLELAFQAGAEAVQEQLDPNTTFGKIIDGVNDSRMAIATTGSLSIEQRREINGPLLNAVLFLRSVFRVMEEALAQNQQPNPLTDESQMYYLQDTRGYVGNCPLWWGLQGKGYTTDLRKAEKYTLDDAMRQHRSRESDIPWLCSEIDAIQRPTVDAQDMPRSHVHQREVVKSVHSIKDGI